MKKHHDRSVAVGRNRLTNISGETHCPHAFTEFQTRTHKPLRQLYGLLFKRLLRRNVEREMRRTREILIMKPAIVHFLVYSQEHDLRDLYPRVKVLDLLLLRLLERVRRQERLDLVVRRVVQFRRARYQRCQRLEQDEARGGVPEGALEKLIVFPQEREPV